MSFFQMFSGLLGFGDIPKTNLKNMSKSTSNSAQPTIKNTRKNHNYSQNNMNNMPIINNRNTNKNLNKLHNNPLVGGKKRKTMRNKRK
jgi:hypothetical protein